MLPRLSHPLPSRGCPLRVLVQVICWSTITEDAAARAFAQGFYDAVAIFLDQARTPHASILTLTQQPSSSHNPQQRLSPLSPPPTQNLCLRHPPTQENSTTGSRPPDWIELAFFHGLKNFADDFRLGDPAKYQHSTKPAPQPALLRL